MDNVKQRNRRLSYEQAVKQMGMATEMLARAEVLAPAMAKELAEIRERLSKATAGMEHLWYAYMRKVLEEKRAGNPQVELPLPVPVKAVK